MDQFLNATNHQGIAAKIDDYKTYELDELLRKYTKGKDSIACYVRWIGRSSQFRGNS